MHHPSPKHGDQCQRPTRSSKLKPFQGLQSDKQSEDQMRVQPPGAVRPSAQVGVLRRAVRPTSRVHVHHTGVNTRCACLSAARACRRMCVLLRRAQFGLSGRIYTPARTCTASRDAQAQGPIIVAFPLSGSSQHRQSRVATKTTVVCRAIGHTQETSVSGDKQTPVVRESSLIVGQFNHRTVQR